MIPLNRSQALVEIFDHRAPPGVEGFFIKIEQLCFYFDLFRFSLVEIEIQAENIERGKIGKLK